LRIFASYHLRMRRTTIVITFFLIINILSGCFIGAGTHGQIKEYHFGKLNEEIVSIVDIFLATNPEYCDTVIEDNGCVYIKIPSTNDKFGFRIGGHSEIVLIAAGKGNGTPKWEADLGYFEKQRFIESFEKNFIEKLKGIKPRKAKLLKEPFILSVNQNIDTLLWPHYVFNYDTLVAYPLPNEIDSTNIDYFKKLVLAFSNQSNQKVDIIQYYNIFRINQDYSGFISDSIYVTAYYRLIGRERKFSTLFNQQNWLDYISTSNHINKQENYKNIRADRVKKGYADTDVYSEYSQELWMHGNNNLKRKNGS
jgi:hypothetical protein